MTGEFRAKIRTAIADPALQQALDANAERRIKARQEALASLPEDWHTLRQRAHRVRSEVIDHLDAYLAEFTRQAQANGLIVLRTSSAQEAVDCVLRIAAEKGARLIAKSKSMVSEEINLNHALEARDIDVVETDLGEYIVQLRGERPAHLITPAIHLRRQEVGITFQEKLGVPYTEDIFELVQIARRTLRQVFLAADVGISGVNFGVVEDGTLCLVTNEGNGRMVTSLPATHIALMGIERLVPTREDLALMLRLLPRSATGQKLTVYTSLIRGPAGSPGHTPTQRYLVLVDNGRSALRGSPLEEALYCIRCGACLNACPVYREIGGHGYIGTQGETSPYAGPIGSVIAPGLFGNDQFAHLARASSLCGACKEACPVDIDLPKLLLRVRAGVQPDPHAQPARPNAPAGLSIGLRTFTWVASDAKRYKLAQRALGFLGKLFSRSGWIVLPPQTGWGYSKDFPQPAARPFSDRFVPEASDALAGNTTQFNHEAEVHSPQNTPLTTSGSPTPTSSSARFEQELTALGGRFSCCHPHDLSRQILDLLQQRGIGTLAAWGAEHLPDGLFSSLVQAGVHLEHYARPDHPAGLTGALAGIAETGSLVLVDGPGQSLAVSLIPQIHIAVLAESDIFSDLDRALQTDRLRQAASAVLISGPSRTADIEMSLTIGVHGPGELHVFCLRQ